MKTWQTPKLIALVRSKPEEAVLTACKTIHAGAGSPTVHDYECDLIDTCNWCQGPSNS